MKFMMLHKTDAYYENGGLPSKELIAGVGGMVGEMVRSGKLLAADGLRSSAQGVRLKFSGGKRTVIKGPLEGENEAHSGLRRDARALARRGRRMGVAVCGRRRRRRARHPAGHRALGHRPRQETRRSHDAPLHRDAKSRRAIRSRHAADASSRWSAWAR